MQKIKNGLGLSLLLMFAISAIGCSGGGSTEESATVAPGDLSKKFQTGDDSTVKATPSTSTE